MAAGGARGPRPRDGCCPGFSSFVLLSRILGFGLLYTTLPLTHLLDVELGDEIATVAVLGSQTQHR